MNASFWYLENIDVTGLFCPDKMMDMPQLHREETYKKGEFIYIGEKDSSRIFFILRGRVKIGTMGEDKKELIKAILGPGEVFGELALVEQNLHNEYAQAMEDTEVCSIPQDEIRNLYRDRSGIMTFFLRLMGQKVMALESQLERLVFKDSKSRVIDFLVDMVHKKGQRVGYEHVVRKFLTHQEIANLTATSRQTVTTVLNDLRTKGIIKFDRRRLLVNNLEKLQAQIKK